MDNFAKYEVSMPTLSEGLPVNCVIWMLADGCSFGTVGGGNSEIVDNSTLHYHLIYLIVCM